VLAAYRGYPAGDVFTGIPRRGLASRRADPGRAGHRLLPRLPVLDRFLRPGTCYAAILRPPPTTRPPPRPGPGRCCPRWPRSPSPSPRRLADCPRAPPSPTRRNFAIGSAACRPRQPAAPAALCRLGWPGRSWPAGWLRRSASCCSRGRRASRHGCLLEAQPGLHRGRVAR